MVAPEAAREELMMKGMVAVLAGLLATAGAASSQAASTVGSVAIQVSLTRACSVNQVSGGTDFGTLDFGAAATLFRQRFAELQGSATSGITILCSPGADATLTFLSGANDGAAAGATRAMASNAFPEFVPYDIYHDSGLSQLISPGTQVTVTADGTPQVVSVYGKALGVQGLRAGVFTDTIGVQLDF